MSIKISSLDIEFIKKVEGLRNSKYLCAAGYYTIGYGHKILKHEKFESAISIAEAEILLKYDLEKSTYSVLKYIDSKLNINQFAALVSFTFNVGGAALQRSTLRQKINYGQYYDAADEFLRWIYIGCTKSKGLMMRRRLERALFLK